MGEGSCAAVWRAMTRADIDAVHRLSEAIHPGLPEPAETFCDRLAIWPQGSLVLEAGEAVRGYAVAHPIRLPEPPALGASLGFLPPGADALYVHDVAIVPQERGKGHVGPVLDRLVADARGLRTACLIAVYGTSVAWRRYGFVEAPGLVSRAKLASYGPDAVFMARPLA